MPTECKTLTCCDLDDFPESVTSSDDDAAILAEDGSPILGEGDGSPILPE